MEKEEKLKGIKRFRIGKRVLKTAFAVLLCFMVYSLRGRQGAPFNCAVAAIMCLQPNLQGTRRAATYRITGTAIGTVYAVILVYLQYYGVVNSRWLYPMIAIGVICVLETAVVAKQAFAADFSCVTFLSIVGAEIVGAPYIFIINRVLDMLIGIGIAFMVNSVRLPKRRRDNVLFIADIDRTFREEDGGLAPFSKVILNRLIQDGVKFSISTRGTPATLMNFRNEVQLNMPAVVMDGCALYDIQNNKYILKTRLSAEIVREIERLANKRGIVCCFSAIVQDVLLIYFERFPHMVMQEVYRQLRKSPYRNYICGPLPEESEEKVVYISIIDETSKIQEFTNTLKNRPFFNEIRIREEKAADYPGYSYVRIFNINASRRKTSENLCQMIGAKKVVSLGSKKWAYDVVLPEHDSVAVVKTIRKLYEVNFWERR